MLPARALAIIAGAGSLPRELAESMCERGGKVFIIALQGIADPAAFKSFDHVELRIGQLGALLDILQERGIRDVVLIGSLVRPELKQLMPDPGLLRRLPGIVKAFRGGDDHLLRGVIRLLEGCGLIVHGIHTLAPQLLAFEGALTKRKMPKTLLGDAKRGLALLEAISPFDIGQATVIIGGRIVAVEGVEGTDGMLERVAQMRASGRLRAPNGTGVLAKAAKCGQDLRVDLPAIGPDTVQRCKKAGLSGIVLAAGEVLLAARTQTLATADAEGLFLEGIAR